METSKRVRSLLLVFALLHLSWFYGVWSGGFASELELGAVRAQLAESLPLIEVDRVHQELGLIGSGIEILIVDNWVPIGGLIHGEAVVDVIRAVAPGARLHLCKLDFSRQGSEDIAACLLEAVRQYPGIRVVNMSFAVGDRAFHQPCGFFENSLARAIRRLSRMGVVIVAASGNDGLRGALRFPACLPEVISVGASYDLSGPVEFKSEQVYCRDIASIDKVACYSNVAGYLDLVAPGTVISTPSAPNFGGTSAAAPLVSGVVALMLSADPSLDASTVVELLQQTAASAFDPSSARLFPRVDAYRAVRAVLLPSPPTTSLLIAQFDTDGDGWIDDSEFFRAIDLWVAAQIEDELFFALIDHWVRGVPLGTSGQSIGTLLRGAEDVRIFDLQGRKIMEFRRASSRELRQLLRGLANGVYIYAATVRIAGHPVIRVGKLIVLR
jgi:hypothetical protein